MSLGADYSTLEEHLESERSLRSPTLQRSTLHFDSLLTPPPLVELSDEFESSDKEITPGPNDTVRHHVRPQPSLYDTLLVRALGPQYPADIAARAGTELLVDVPESPFEDRHIFPAHANSPMITVSAQADAATISTQAGITHQEWTASRRASEKLNVALDSQLPVLGAQSHDYHVYGMPKTGSGYRASQNKTPTSISITSITNSNDLNVSRVSNLTIQTSPSGTFMNVLPPPRPVLPLIHTSNTVLPSPHRRNNSLSTSPTLAKYALTPPAGHPSQTLPKLQNQHSPCQASAAVASPIFKQSLPSLETALSSATDSKGTPYINSSPALNRPSPSQHSQYGPSPTLYSQATPIATMSPPRLSSNPASWRTLSQHSSNSTGSEYTSAHGSNHASTPATRSSPSLSAVTPQSHYPPSEHDSNSDSDSHITMGPDGFDSFHQGSKGTQGYLCSYPGCTAAPFQTQYLLNSHTNVHSNQRPHFCPVDGCPRGPGGQGFKRKNEMIRHGLVHQSPGYVCPFCPDQQHRYPRPDNLQRHVRVHHVDRDRDDPMLRDVLAQRPEGGNRGRRRRLGV